MVWVGSDSAMASTCSEQGKIGETIDAEIFAGHAAIVEGDVAAFAAASVENPFAENQVLEIGGPEPLTPSQVIKEFENTSGHSFNVNYIPVVALEQQMKEATDPLQNVFAGLMIFYANGDPIDMEPTLKKIPTKLHSIQDYANAVLKKEAEIA